MYIYTTNNYTSIMLKLTIEMYLMYTDAALKHSTCHLTKV